MVNFHIGTAGWDYKDWIGPFYPKTLERKHHLKLYTKNFDIVEINSTFYNLPSEQMVRNWSRRTPDTFYFIVKVWQEITHKINDNDLDNKVSQFFNRIIPLEKKVKRFLLQFPPWFKHTEKHSQQLKNLLNEVPSDYQYAIELRDNSWFYPKIISDLVDGDRIIFGTTYMPGFNPFYYPNQQAYYIRMIGDRELTVFNRIQRKQEAAMNDLKNKIKILMELPNVSEIFIIVNNHFAGFAPETANIIKEILNLPIRKYNAQKSLLDFI
jgi:uncharacterized protein YecE (DUF72 family)